MSIKVAIIAEQRQSLTGFSVALDNTETVEVVGVFSSGKKAVREIPHLGPDVVLIDIDLPGILAQDIIRKLNIALPSSRMLVHSNHRDKEYLFTALKGGATGYVLKNSTTEEIISAIEETHRGGSPIFPEAARHLIDHFYDAKPESSKEGSVLSKREKNILKNISEGMTSRKIAEQLSISIHTVRTHTRNIYEKLHVHSKLEAVMKARDEGIF